MRRTRFPSNNGSPNRRRTKWNGNGGHRSVLDLIPRNSKSIFPFHQLSNARQAAFINEFIKDFNITRAAKDAGYSAATAHVIGQRLLSNVKIKTALREAIRNRALRLQLDQDKIVKELACIGFSDLTNFTSIDQNGDMVIDLKSAPPEAMRAVQEVTQDVYMEGRGGSALAVKRTKLKLHPKLPALEQIAKHLGLLIDKLQVDETRKVEHEHNHKFDLSGMEIKDLEQLRSLLVRAVSGGNPAGRESAGTSGAGGQGTGAEGSGTLH